MTNFWLSPAVRWDANWFTRGLCLIGLPLVTVVFALSALAVHAQGPGSVSVGYAVASTNQCSGQVADSRGGSPTATVQGRRPMHGTCGWKAGAKVYYDAATLKEVPGPSNYLVGTVVLGLLGAGSAALTILVWVSWVTGRRRRPASAERPNGSRG
ncbi:hypothetical protein AB3X52_14410 [Nocardioides sp. DS6]|uniref:DUF3592 domain-containing protein n=1 Tax=Nocardioides eburneus TaxID=3231482 RepID=A0ABV3T0U2_9ACTN